MVLEKLKKYWKIILGSIVILIMVCLSLIFNQEQSLTQEEVETAVELIPAIENKLEEEVDFIYVDVKGAVKTPGVYQLEEGSRVIHAIEKSGGLKSGADTSLINLSKKLEDGNVLIIYTKDKIEELKAQQKVIEYIEKECVCPDVENQGCVMEEDIIIEQPETEQPGTKQEKVSLNNATKEELLTLPGIGESKAQDIITYRENQKFEKIEDLKNVKGIGDALFEKIKEHITVE